MADLKESEVLQLYLKIADSEQHFNNLQMEYRKLASGWLIAVFTGTGFVLASEEINEIKELLVAGIGYAGFIGICLLWQLDLIIYHRLLRSFFLTGLKMEKEYDWLPKTRSIMIHLDGNKGILGKVVTFYMASSLTPLLISLGSLAYGVLKQPSDMGRIYLYSLILIVLFSNSTLAYLWAATLKTEKIYLGFKDKYFLREHEIYAEQKLSTQS